MVSLSSVLSLWRNHCAFDANYYWDNRHASHRAALTGVGHIGLSEAQNAVDYDAKISNVIGLLEHQIGPLKGQSVLDAGCGIGVLTDAFAKRGARMTGVDFSLNAITLARNAVPKATLQVCALDAIDADHIYDAVICIDVLFHVVDDAKWKSAIRRLLRAAKRGRPILIQEEFIDTNTSADHVRWRTLKDYEAVLIRLGAKIICTETYCLPAEKVEKTMLLVSGSA
jgi:2-polyprenyl-3-methyl-5-hydroxy-6-metoxy-1,4-benzoquinol methylase